MKGTKQSQCCKLLLAFIFLISTSDGFTVPSSVPQIKSHAVTKTALSERIKRLEESYGERIRKDRRDQFTYEKWVRHRANTRFSRNLKNLAKSGVVRQLLDETLFIASIALFVIVFNAFGSVGWDDLTGLHHDPLANFITMRLPLQPFTLSSPALGLLLVFRTNVSYQRWDEARKAWGVVVNNSRTVARQTSAWVKQSDLPYEEKQRLLRRCADCVWAFPRSLTRHLLSEREDEEAFCREVRERLDPDFAEELVRWKRHRPSRALFEMSNAINELPIEMYRRISVDESVSHLCDAMGGCDRIFTSPVPIVYTRHTARFLELWLMFLPLSLWNVLGDSWNHWATIPVSIIFSFFLLGIEELAIQLEEPFSILPLHIITDGIGKSAEEHFEWNEKDSFQMISHLHNAQAAVFDTPTSYGSVAQEHQTAAPPLNENRISESHQKHHDPVGNQYDSLADALRAMTREQ